MPICKKNSKVLLLWKLNVGLNDFNEGWLKRYFERKICMIQP